MRAYVAVRGKKRVSIGARCRIKSHGECTVLECKCPCHGVEEAVTEARKVWA